LSAAGAEVQRGDVEDLESLRAGASACDAVIHLAFNHDFSKFKENCENDRRAIEALGSGLGPGRRLIVTSGTLIGKAAPGQAVTEDVEPMTSEVTPRAASEEAAGAVWDRGVPVSIVRLSQIHDRRKQGLVSFLIQTAQQRGVSAYIGDGLNRWAASPLLDTAVLYRLALEAKATGRYHAVAEEGVALKEIAEAIGRRLDLPVTSLSGAEVEAHFGLMTHFASLDGLASSAWTREQLGWNPTGPSLINDLESLELTT
jgi:NAD dependent epimerase/dehydratase family enzyme